MPIIFARPTDDDNDGNPHLPRVDDADDDAAREGRRDCDDVDEEETAVVVKHTNRDSATAMTADADGALLRVLLRFVGECVGIMVRSD